MSICAPVPHANQLLHDTFSLAFQHTVSERSIVPSPPTLRYLEITRSPSRLPQLASLHSRHRPPRRSHSYLPHKTCAKPLRISPHLLSSASTIGTAQKPTPPPTSPATFLRLPLGPVTNQPLSILILPQSSNHVINQKILRSPSSLTSHQARRPALFHPRERPAFPLSPVCRCIYCTHTQKHIRGAYPLPQPALPQLALPQLASAQYKH